MQRKLTSTDIEQFCELLSIASIDPANPRKVSAEKGIQFYLRYLSGTLPNVQVTILTQVLETLGKDQYFEGYGGLFAEISADIKNNGAMHGDIITQETDEGLDFDAVLEKLQKDHDNRVELSAPRTNVAQLKMRTGTTHYERAVMSLTKFTEEKTEGKDDDSPEFFYRFTRVYSDNFVKLLEVLERRRVLVEELAMIDPHDRSADQQRTIAGYHLLLANSYQMLNVQSSARTECYTAIEELKYINPMESKDHQVIAAVRAKIADSYYDNEQYLDAIGECGLAITELEKIASLTNAAYRDLAAYHGKMGDSYNGLSEHELAQKEWGLAISELSKVEPKAAQDYDSIAQYHRNNAVLHASFSEYKQSITEYQAAIRELTKIAPLSTYEHRQLAEDRGSLAAHYFHHLQDYKLASEEWELAIKDLKAIGALTPIEYRDKGLYHNNRSRCYFLLNNYKEAQEQIRLAIEAYKKPIDIDQQDYKILARLHERLADTYLIFGEEMAACEEWYSAVTEIMKFSSLENHDHAHLANLRARIAEALLKLKKYAPALAEAQKALDEFNQVLPASLSEADLSLRAKLYEKIAEYTSGQPATITSSSSVANVSVFQPTRAESKEVNLIYLLEVITGKTGWKHEDQGELSVSIKLANEEEGKLLAAKLERYQEAVDLKLTKDSGSDQFILQLESVNTDLFERLHGAQIRHNQ